MAEPLDDVVGAVAQDAAQLRALAEAIPGIIFVSDPAGHNTYVNPYFTALVGRSADSLLRDGWIDLVHTEDASRVIGRWQNAVAAEIACENEYRLRDRDGNYRWFLVRVVPVHDGEGRVLAWYGVGIDIDDRKRIEAAMQDNEKRLRLALEAGSIGTFEVDLDTRTRHWDPRLAAMFGLAPAATDIEAARIHDFAHPDDLERIVSHFEAAVTTGRLGELEFRIITRGGETRWVASTGLVLPGHGGAGRMIGAMRDITEQRRRETALQDALAAREILVREADHRIKNSLQLVVGLLTLQRRRVADPEAAEALASAAARVEAVAQSHLALQQSQDFRTVDFGQALRELCTRLDGLTTGVELRCDVAETVALDAERAIPLALIVSELLTNAMRHAYPDGAGAVTICMHTTSQEVAVTIADAGVGYDPNERKTGLGATIVQTLARQIVAEVQTQTSPGGGTCTVVRLPKDSK